MVIFIIYVIGVIIIFYYESRFSIIFYQLGYSLFLFCIIMKVNCYIIGRHSLLLIAVSTLLKQNTIAIQGNTSTAKSSSTFENLNTDLQLYFSGVSNVAHSIDTSYVYAPFQFDAIISDLFRSVMF